MVRETAIQLSEPIQPVGAVPRFHNDNFEFKLTQWRLHVGQIVLRIDPHPDEFLYRYTTVCSVGIWLVIRSAAHYVCTYMLHL